MSLLKRNEFLFNKVSSLKGVGTKLTKYLKNKKIEKINDLLWDLPYSYTDRSQLVNISDLEIGKIQTIKVKINKLYFPRIRNLPNRIQCEDNTGKIDLVYFNSREGYLRKIFKLNEWNIISGKVSLFKNKAQITNPDYVTGLDNINYVATKIPKYSLSDGLTEKSYRKIIDSVLSNLKEIDEWYDKETIDKLKLKSWKNSLSYLHKNFESKNIDSDYYRRLAFDEIMSFLISKSKNRKKIKIKKTERKVFNNVLFNKLVNKLKFKLTKDQLKAVNDINSDLKSKDRMFRLLQGDVGSGKTIVSILAIVNVIQSGFQCALMAPTEILAKQHFDLILKTFLDLNIKVEFLVGKTPFKEKKIILEKLKQGKIDLLIGTHALFQTKINFSKLGLIVVDEQHKFGVKQRMDLANKGGVDCDVLLMSATPIPRTIMLTLYGDMDISRIIEKPKNRKMILTLSKPENKISELIPLINKHIENNDQVFWVCPLIDKSTFLDYSSAKTRFEKIKNIFPKKVGLIYGSLKKEEKDKIIDKFKKKEIKILVSTTVIEVGIDFPDANLIIIENSDKFGLAQLHQLRGRVGRGTKQGICILLYKGNLSNNAIQRIKILKSSNDGFHISEKDMHLRGFGDLIGFQQSGIKFFKVADPVKHQDLFRFAESYIKKIEIDNNLNKFNFLLKLFDKAEIISKKEILV